MDNGDCGANSNNSNSNNGEVEKHSKLQAKQMSASLAAHLPPSLLLPYSLFVSSHSFPLSLSPLLTHLSLSGTRIYAQFLFTNFGKCRTSVCPLCVCVCVCALLCCTIWKVRLKLTEILRNVQNSLWRRVAATETTLPPLALHERAHSCLHLYTLHLATSKGIHAAQTGKFCNTTFPFTGYGSHHACPLGAPQLSPLLYCAH